MTRKIGTGIYPAGTYLPYEAQLAKQYGVSAYTVAAYTAPQFSEDDLEQLAVHIMKPGIALTNLFQMILKHLSLEPLHVIWHECSQITEWGFYFAFYPQGGDVIVQLNDITRRAYHCLRAGKSTEFAENLADCYRLILTSVQAHMVEKHHFTEALSVQVPDRDSLK